MLGKITVSAALLTVLAFAQTIPAGTHIAIRTAQELSSGSAKVGDHFDVTLTHAHRPRFPDAQKVSPFLDRICCCWGNQRCVAVLSGRRSRVAVTQFPDEFLVGHCHCLVPGRRRMPYVLPSLEL